MLRSTNRRRKPSRFFWQKAELCGRRVVLFFGLLSLITAVGGCQRGPTWDLATVEGTVTKAGRPLAKIQVIFWADVKAGAKGPRTFGFTDATGHYKLRTDMGEQGAAIGQYRVCLLHSSEEDMLAGLDGVTAAP